MLASLRLFLSLWVPALARPADATYLGRPAGLLAHLGVLLATAALLLLFSPWAGLAFFLLYGLGWVGAAARAGRAARQAGPKGRFAWERACARARRDGNWVRDRPLFLLLGYPPAGLAPLLEAAGLTYARQDEDSDAPFRLLAVGRHMAVEA